MVVPYLAVAFLLGPEFPSLVGGLVGLAAAVPVARRGLLLPAERFDFPPRPFWEPGWSGTVEPGETPKEPRTSARNPGERSPPADPTVAENPSTEAQKRHGLDPGPRSWDPFVGSRP